MIYPEERDAVVPSRQGTADRSSLQALAKSLRNVVVLDAATFSIQDPDNSALRVSMYCSELGGVGGGSRKQQ